MDVNDAINGVKLENNKNKKQCLVKAKDYPSFLLCVFHEMEIILCCCFINGRMPKFVSLQLCASFSKIYIVKEN